MSVYAAMVTGSYESLSPAEKKEIGVRAHFRQDIGFSIGPYILGAVTDLVLLGVLLGQMWHWATWTRQERTLIKIIVGWVLTCALASSSFCLAWFFYLFVDHYGEFAPFVNNRWFQWFPFVGQLLLLACHIFNLERAYRLHHRKLWPIFTIVPFMLVGTGAQLGIKIKTGAGADFRGGAQVIRPYMTTYLSTIFVVDVLLSGIIAWGLWMNKTGWVHTDILIKKIITFSWEAQLPPALMALAMLVGFVVRPDSPTGFYFMICYAKVTAVAFMAVLNFRFALRHDQTTRHGTTTGIYKSRVQDPRNDSDFLVDQDDIPMVRRETVRFDGLAPGGTSVDKSVS